MGRQRCGFSVFSDSKCCWLDTLQSKKYKIVVISIKFDELIYNNENNTFTKNGQMARQPSSLLLSPHIVNEPCFEVRCFIAPFFDIWELYRYLVYFGIQLKDFLAPLFVYYVMGLWSTTFYWKLQANKHVWKLMTL